MSEIQTAGQMPPRRWWQPFHPRRWEGHLFHWLSDRSVGGESVPLSWTHGDFAGDKICPAMSVGFTDDAFELAFSYQDSDRCSLILRRPMWHRMLRWYLWQWAVHEGFGLRRWLWYRLLTRRLRAHERFMVQWRAQQPSLAEKTQAPGPPDA